MVAVQIVSDLHIEYKNDKPPDPLDLVTPAANILILAGDIGSLYKINQLTKFLEKLCSHFSLVLYVPGNHEWYTQPGFHPLPRETLQKRLLSLEHNIPNLQILDKKGVIVDDVCIAGCTLWSKPNCIIPPFLVRIKDMTNSLFSRMHNADLNYLKNVVGVCERKKYKLLVVTHYPPTMEVLNNECKNHRRFPSLYASNLEYLLDGSKINTWVCGHVHRNFDFRAEKGTRVISNQKGKPSDRVDDYVKNYVITI